MIDKNRHIGEVFCSLQYDDGLMISVLLNGDKESPSKLNIGDSAFMYVKKCIIS